MRRLLAALLCASVTTTACASAAGPRFQVPAPADRTSVLMADFVKRLPIGARVRVELAEGHRLKGTLMKADETGIVIRRNTRLPEPPLEIAINRIAAIELDTGNSTGRTIAIGAASAAGGVLAVFGILALIFSGID